MVVALRGWAWNMAHLDRRWGDRLGGGVSVAAVGDPLAVMHHGICSVLGM